MYILVSSQASQDFYYNYNAGKGIAKSPLASNIKNVIVPPYIGGGFGVKDHTQVPFYGILASLFAHDKSVNLLVAPLYGIKPQHYSTLVSFDAMPGYDKDLSDSQLTELVNYLKAAFTPSTVCYTEAEMKQLRKDIEENQQNAAH